MSESLINLLETIADVVIVGICTRVAWLFWRTFVKMKSQRNLGLAAAFALVAAFKLFQVATDGFLGMAAFKWMDTVLAGEALIIFLGVAVIVVLSGGGRQSRVLKKPEYRRTGRRRGE